jgi:hypothetical protein
MVQEGWLLLKLVADIGVIQKILDLQACRMKKVWIHVGFLQDFKGRHVRPQAMSAMSPRERPCGLQIARSYQWDCPNPQQFRTWHHMPHSG